MTDLERAREIAAGFWRGRDGATVDGCTQAALAAIKAEREAVVSWVNNCDPQLADAIEKGAHHV